MAKIIWTSEAERWITDIYDYIAVDNPIAAKKVVRGIYKRVQILSQFPEIGYRYEESARNVRILLYGHYRIAYLVTESQDCSILGVFHGSLDIVRHIKI